MATTKISELTAILQAGMGASVFIEVADAAATPKSRKFDVKPILDEVDQLRTDVEALEAEEHPVTSVAGKTGAVTLAKADITDLGTIGTMAAQGAGSVAITGGTISGLTSLATTTISNTVFNYLVGVTSNIQDQIDGIVGGSGITDLTGDVTASGTGSVVATLASVGTAGTYRSVTTDAKGRVTAGTNPTTFAGYGISDSSASLLAALTDKTGTGVAVFATSPTLVTPILGVATATSLNAGASTFTGQVVIPDGSSTVTGINVTGRVNTGFSYANGGVMGLYNGTAGWSFNNGIIELASTTELQWGSTTSPLSSTDVKLLRDGAASTLALRNGTAAQTFNVYNTWTDASNYERASLVWSGNVFTVGTVAAGTGVARTVHVGAGSGAALRFYSSGTLRWDVSSSGHFIANADNAYDIGASGATRPRNVYVAGLLEVGSSITGASHIRAGSSGWFYWNGRSVIQSPANSIIKLSNQADTDFDRLQFGGTSASFPAWKRSSAILQGRLADDSAFCAIQGKLTTDTAYTNTPVVETGYLTIYDSTGTAYQVGCKAA